MTSTLPTYRHRTYWALLAAVALLQTGLLSKMVYDRQTLLRSGREIVLQVQPVDPRDLFRGDYVILGYAISPVSISPEANGAPLDGIMRGAPVYVTLSPDASGAWAVKQLSPAYPSSAAASDIVLKGLVQHVWQGAKQGEKQYSIKYGIESYFVPEGTGRALEASVREKKIQAVIAVATDGTA
ncbi:MAG: GDYXXLXY domain-containing protein, partial [Hyphomicrobium sp.]